MPQSRALRFSAAPAVHGSPGRVRGSGRGAREGGHCAPGSCSLGAAPVCTGTLPGGRAHTRRPAGGMRGTEAPESSLSREGAPARLGSSSQRTGEGGQQCRRQVRARRGGGDVGVGAPSSGVQLADGSWAWSRRPRPRPAPLSCAVLGVKVGPWTEASGRGGECPAWTPLRAGPGGGGWSGPDAPTAVATTQDSVLPDAPKMKVGRTGRALGCCVLHTSPSSLASCLCSDPRVALRSGTP